MEADMTLWIVRRLFQAIFVMVTMTLIVFVGLHAIGNPVDILISPDADQNERMRAIAALGLDQPLWRQYLAFLFGIMRGDFGTSFVFGAPAMQIIFQRLPATLELAVSAVILSVVIGIPLGLYAGLRPNSLAAKTMMAGSIIGFSLPSFWIGLMLIMVFAVEFGWLPSSGRGQTVEVFGISWSFLTWDGLKHLMLPALNMSLSQISLIMRLTRAGVREVLPQEFIKFARAKGISERRVIFVHVLKNTMIPIVTVIGLEFGTLLAFAVVTESIFAWPGMGKLLIDSINMIDRPMVVAYLILVVFIFVTINLVVDLLYTLLDPRIRLEQEG